MLVLKISLLMTMPLTLQESQNRFKYQGVRAYETLARCYCVSQELHQLTEMYKYIHLHMHGLFGGKDVNECGPHQRGTERLSLPTLM